MFHSEAGNVSVREDLEVVHVFFQYILSIFFRCFVLRVCGFVGNSVLKVLVLFPLSPVEDRFDMTDNDMLHVVFTGLAQFTYCLLP